MWILKFSSPAAAFSWFLNLDIVPLVISKCNSLFQAYLVLFQVTFVIVRSSNKGELVKSFACGSFQSLQNRYCQEI